MAQAWAGTPQVPLERRRAERAMREAMQGQVFEIAGSLPMTGIGEALRQVHFPVNFIERPAIFGSGALEDGETLVPGKYPTWRVGVAAYRTEVRAGATLYTGATLCIVVTGVVGQKSVVSWNIRGKALRNPIQ